MMFLSYSRLQTIAAKKMHSNNLKPYQVIISLLTKLITAITLKSVSILPFESYVGIYIPSRITSQTLATKHELFSLPATLQYCIE